MPAPDPRTVKLYTRLRPEDHKRLRLRAAEKDLSIPDAAELAIRQWLESSTKVAPEPEPQIETPGTRNIPEAASVKIPSQNKEITLSEEDWAWVERALTVKHGGIHTAVESLDKNLDAFVLLTDLAKGQPGERQRASVPAARRAPVNLEKALADSRNSEEELEQLMEEAVPGRTETPQEGTGTHPARSPDRDRGKPRKGSFGSGS